MTAPRDHQGWLLFAGIMILIAGVLNLVSGVAALSDSGFFVDHATYIVGDLHTWGWIFLVLGALEVFAAFSIWKHGEFGRFFGLAVATIGIVGSLLSLAGHPAFAIATGALHVLVVYGLAVYGGRGLEADLAMFDRPDEDEAA